MHIVSYYYRKWSNQTDGLRQRIANGSERSAELASLNRHPILVMRRDASPRGGFLFHARNAQNSLKSPLCSFVSITLPALS